MSNGAITYTDPSQALNRTIGDLPAATTVSATDLGILQQGYVNDANPGVTSKVTFAQLAGAITTAQAGTLTGSTITTPGSLEIVLGASGVAVEFISLSNFAAALPNVGGIYGFTSANAGLIINESTANGTTFVDFTLDVANGVTIGVGGVGLEIGAGLTLGSSGVGLALASQGTLGGFETVTGFGTITAPGTLNITGPVPVIAQGAGAVVTTSGTTTTVAVALASQGTLGGIQSVFGYGTLIAPGTIEITTPSSVTEVFTGTGLSGGPITGTGTIALTPATTTALGGVVVGTGHTLTGTGTLGLAVASTAALGGVVVGTGHTVNAGGTLSVVPATTTALGGVVIGPGLITNSGGTISTVGTGSGSVTEIFSGAGLSGGPITTTGTLALIPATTAALGGLIVGAGLATNAGGTVSTTNAGSVTEIFSGVGLTGGPITGTGTLAVIPATTAALGGVVIGGGITVNSGGTISASGSGGGGVSEVFTGAGLTGGPITTTGTIGMVLAAQGTLGGVETITNAGAVLSGGTLTLPTATATTLGLAAAGTNLTVSNGTFNATGTLSAPALFPTVANAATLAGSNILPIYQGGTVANFGSLAGLVAFVNAFNAGNLPAITVTGTTIAHGTVFSIPGTLSNYGTIPSLDMSLNAGGTFQALGAGSTVSNPNLVIYPGTIASPGTISFQLKDNNSGALSPMVSIVAT